MESADHHGGGKLPWMAAISLPFTILVKKETSCPLITVSCRTSSAENLKTHQSVEDETVDKIHTEIVKPEHKSARMSLIPNITTDAKW